ncbi:MAG: sigma-70 family RNA polymerase sigma factor [Planctomycetota bacterium]|jgi:RNA polymerase sigma factor (sigma-70 family)
MECVDPLREDPEPALREAHRAGRAAHPTVEVLLDAFSSRLLAAVGARSKGGGLPGLIEQTPAADFYLATACELDLPGAWDRLAEVYAAPVRTMALRWGASPADAEEIAAGLPGELVQPPAHGRHATQLGGYEGSGSLLAFIARIVDRRLVDRMRRRRPDANQHLDGSPAPAGSPSDSIIHTETGERVANAFQGALEELSKRDFELLVLRFRDGLRQKEIAERQGVSAARVSYLMKRVLTRVRHSVLQAVPDETSAYWLDREGLAIVLKGVIARILGNRE